MVISGWRGQAACIGADPAKFDPPPTQRLNKASRDRAEFTVSAYCARCPVQEDCLTDAVLQGDIGVRGGLMITEEILAKLRRRRAQAVA